MAFFSRHDPTPFIWLFYVSKMCIYIYMYTYTYTFAAKKQQIWIYHRSIASLIICYQNNQYL